MADYRTNSKTTDSLKIHVMSEDIYEEIERSGAINENELYLVEGSGDIVLDDGPIPLTAGGTGVAVQSVAELRTVLQVAPSDHTSTEKSCGIGNGIKYGHVKLSDAVDLDSDASEGIAATPGALKNLYDLIKELIDSKADINSTGTIASTLMGYADIMEWSDGNKNGDNRIGYFVSSDITKSTSNIVKATSTSNIHGVTVEKPGFTTNAGNFKFDTEGNLLQKYTYVMNSGIVTVIDDGTCVVGSTCMSNDSGIATPSINDMGYQVISRVDNNHIIIFMEPQISNMIKFKNDMNNKQNLLTWTTMDDIDAMIAGTYDPETIGGAIDADDNLMIFLVKDE